MLKVSAAISEAGSGVVVKRIDLFCTANPVVKKAPE